MMRRRLPPLAVLLLLSLPAAAPAARPAAVPAATVIAQAQALLDAGDPEAALPLLDRLLGREPKNAPALLLRSTARFMIGEVEAGKRDLDRALALDPALRQGWLNRAAVALSEQRHEEALAALEKARDLDPAAIDNDLNIGAVELLLGRLESASESFSRYLARLPGAADALYLVASNYAMTGYAGLALQHLQQAVALDERMRLRARTDPNFASLAQSPRFQEVLLRDSWQVTAGAHTAGRTYDFPYAGGDGPLLQAALDALQLSGEPMEPRVEVTPDWALLWGRMRVRLSQNAQGQGVVELTAPPEAFTADQWQRRSKQLLDSIFIQLAKRGQRPAPPDEEW
ncbi:MAG TPA: tetratricopeptide repeat protein [Thermoanaerobaculia bacterium]|nr:tetratricopeptide repeat protein [Thermoanaerobaculia bacterium]